MHVPRPANIDSGHAYHLPAPPSACAPAVFVDDSALLKHECAYCLGQMQNTHALPVLEAVLRDAQQDTMVRHEAAEALGAIGDESSMAVLEEYKKDPAVEVAETCEIAVDRLRWAIRERAQKEAGASCATDGDGKKAAAEAGAVPTTTFTSVDPAPASEDASDVPTATLREQYLDTKLSLFERYRALFALRNRNTEESVLAIVEGLEDSSALFRHEVAYVLGQMQHPASVPGLVASLKKPHESPMVRDSCLVHAVGSVHAAACFLFPVRISSARVEMSLFARSLLVC